MKWNFFVLATAIAVITLLSSCSRGISPYEAANGKVKCGRHVN